MSDITKIEETRYKDDGDWEEWPYPTIEITSRVTGELKDKILKLTDREPSDTTQITIVETNISAGWSEWTQDDDYGLAVYVGTVKVREWTYQSSERDAMAKFLAWVN